MSHNSLPPAPDGPRTPTALRCHCGGFKYTTHPILGSLCYWHSRFAEWAGVT